MDSSRAEKIKKTPKKLKRKDIDEVFMLTKGLQDTVWNDRQMWGLRSSHTYLAYVHIPNLGNKLFTGGVILNTIIRRYKKIGINFMKYSEE